MKRKIWRLALLGALLLTIFPGWVHAAALKSVRVMPEGTVKRYSTEKYRKITSSSSKILSVKKKKGKFVVTAKKKGDATLKFYRKNGSVSKVYVHVQKENGYLIVLDPGHQTKAESRTEPIGPGSKTRKARVSGGATGVSTGQKEYELNLSVAKKLKKELESRGYDVKMTRTENNVSMSNKERAEFANELQADAVIRIHANSCGSSKVKGILTMCQTSRNPYNGDLYSVCRDLSEKVLKATVSATGAKKREIIETDTMTGINWSEVPVTIVEMGFLSNPSEDKKMATAGYQTKLARGIADGLDDFFGLER